MTIEELKQKGLILLECISGSRAYGLATPSSDTDIKGVFLLPRSDFYTWNYIPQVSNVTNDIVYYELGRYLELLSLNNPNILELLYTPKTALLYKHPYLDAIKAELFLSKLCKNTFGKFALSQIKKARGLKKKIVNPMDKKRKTVLSFCYVNDQHGAVPLLNYLAEKRWRQEDCGLVKIPHMKNIYGLYHNVALTYQGIIRKENSNEVALSAIPKGEAQVALLYFNQDGYGTYCKTYREYWNWVAQRNEERYLNNTKHGKDYDAKHMMHTFRLLEMAIEIAKTQKVNVRREDRAFLLAVKAGDYEYSHLLELAQSKQEEMEAAFETSSLPEKPDESQIKKLAFNLRAKFYDSDQWKV